MQHVIENKTNPELKLIIFKPNDNEIKSLTLNEGDALDETFYLLNKEYLILSEKETTELFLLTKEWLGNKNRRHVFNNYMDILFLKELICESLHIENPHVLISKSRKEHIVIGRHLLTTILRWCNYGSLEQIGRVVCRHHSTIIYSEKKILDIIDTKNSFYYSTVTKVLDYYGLTYKYSTR